MATIKGSHVLGKLSRNVDKKAPRNCEARLTWGGQCVDTLAALFPRDKRAQRIRDTWEQYHLNGMNAGTREQSRALEAGRAAIVKRIRREGDAAVLFYHDGTPNWYAIARQLGKDSSHTVDCDILRAAGLLEVPVTEDLRASALGGLPADATTYKYGSRWLYRAIPDNVLALIRAGFLVPGAENNAADADEAGEPDRDFIAELGLSISAQFIPWSQSRNKGEKQPSLNWRVTLKKDGRNVLTTDYSAGSAHCPAHKSKATAAARYDRQKAIESECESGRVARLSVIGAMTTNKPIEPNARDVIGSLLLDASILDCAGFEDWCSEFGYDSDSRKARKTFDQCMEHALAFRAAVGAAKFEELRQAAQ